MSKVLISTSVRYTKNGQPSGRLLVFDLDKKTVVKSCEIIEPPYREYDPNPRGGFRGLKGISVYGECIAIANASTVFLYNNEWKPLEYIWHPSCAGIHDIFLLEDRIWVTSSRNDLLFCFDFKGRIIKYIDAREVKTIKKHSKHQVKTFLSANQVINGKINFRDPRTHDHAVTDALHVNSLIVLKNGDLLVSCGLLRVIDDRLLHKINHLLKQTLFSSIYSKSYQLYRKILKLEEGIQLEDTAISKKESSSIILNLNLDNSEKKYFVLNKCAVPSHSIRLLDSDRLIYLNSTSGEIVCFDLIEDEICFQEVIGEKFLRGATILEDQSVLMGDNDSIVHYNYFNKKVVSRTSISKDPAEAIFDIHILPENFLLPPQSFVEHHKRYLPIDQVGG